ncbi:hypothetical protein [Candidatus Vidania fulgoroideorum]
MKELTKKYIEEINNTYNSYKKNIIKIKNMEIDIYMLKNIKLKNKGIYIKNISNIYEKGNKINIEVRKTMIKETIKEISNYNFIKFKVSKNIIEIGRKIEAKYKNELIKRAKENIELFKIKTRTIISKLKKEVKTKLGIKFKINKELESIRKIVSLQVKQLYNALK